LNVENSTFTPLVFSVFGGMGVECQMFFKRLCHLLSEKCGENISIVTAWVRTKILFALLHSTLMCIRGCRYRYINPIANTSIALDVDAKIRSEE